MDLDVDTIGKFVALGGTFVSHQAEKDRSYRWPDLWLVPPEAVIPEESPIRIPQRTEDVKPASELTAVIGDDLWQASEQEAWEAIKGFTISNDVTVSGEWPGWSDPDHGMITGVGYKIFPTFSPILTDYQPKQSEKRYKDLDVTVHVDGDLAVEGSTSQMAFSIPEMVSFASKIVNLEENDVVALGDPGSPTKTLDTADSVVCSIESIGELRNTINQI
jgi:2-keto-4-pentenoate hydratase/2-oxohepta-3-ene-1,7-dioic acid hydratase in catechol pathway